MDQEIAPDEAGIETDRIRAKQVESLQTRKHPSALADEHKPVVGERLGKSFETTPHKDEIETARIQAEQGESFQTRQHSHHLGVYRYCASIKRRIRCKEF
jgi:hypothetical protein